MIVVTKKIAFTTQARRKCIVAPEVAARRLRVTPRPPRIPRVARLMALAIQFDQMLREGVVSDQSDLAHLAHVTQPRMTQILNLNHLAPDIQEELLFLTGTPRGREHIHERGLRMLCAHHNWQKQRNLWLQLKQRSDVSVHTSPVEEPCILDKKAATTRDPELETPSRQMKRSASVR